MEYSEWGTARVVLAVDKDKQPRPLQAPGYKGCGKDVAVCVFCGKGFPALVDRLRKHVAGRPEGVTTPPAGVTYCPGPRQEEDEEPAAFATRKDQFLAARAGAKGKAAELAAVADAKSQQVALDKATAPQSYVPGGAKARPLKQAKMTDSSARHVFATEALARGVYSAGLAPNVLDNKLFRRGLLAVAEAGAGWQPPSAKELLGALLVSEEARVRSDIAAARATTARVGVVLVGDGATNVRREPILNVLSVQANRVEFIKAENFAGRHKSMRLIADDMIEVIKKLPDPEAVVAVYMDNATRGAWPLIEEACPWVVCGACGPHVVDLLMEDVGKLPFFKALFAKGNEIRLFVKNHTHVKAAFDKVCKRAIVNPADTRFATEVLGLSNVIVNREALVSTFGAPAVVDAIAKAKNDRQEVHGTLGAQFTYLQQLVNNGDFWAEAAWAQAVMKPMERLLRFLEQDAPTSSLAYHAWFQVQNAIEEMEGLPAELKDAIIKSVGYRWDYGFNMLHGAGYVLDPQFRLCEPPQECMDSFNDFVLKCYPKPLRRNFDDEDAFNAARDAHIDLLASIDRQLLDYRRGNGVWGREAVQRNAQLVSAVDFWDMYGQQPLLRVALRACGCVAGATAAERGHKEMNFIHSKQRNSLGWEKAEKLMYVRINLNITHRAVDYTNITNTMFELEEGEEPELPCAWREAAEEEEAAPPLPVALERSKRRASALSANRAAAAKAAPLPAPTAERGDGRRVVKRPRMLEDFE
jgi:hypothetical protein